MSQQIPTSIKRYIPTVTALNNKELEACNSINCLSIPSGVKVYISFKLSPNDEEKYDLYMNSSYDLKLVHEYSDALTLYLHTEGTSTEDIILVLNNVSKDKPSLVIQKNPEEVSILESVLARIEKASDKYNPPINIFIQSTSLISIQLLNKILTCDKIIITLDCGWLALGGNNSIFAKLDGVYISQLRNVNDATVNTKSSSQSVTIELENVLGKTLTIDGFNNSGYTHFCIVQQYTLKA